MIDIGRNEEICREMDKLANEDHTHSITEEEIRVYRNNWWIRSNILSSDATNVEDINILHIKESLSLSFVASFEDWFCLFRT